MTGLSRRSFLGLGAAGAAVVGAVGVGGLAATGRLGQAVVLVRRRVQGCGPSPAAPAVAIGRIDTGAFTSARMGGATTRFAIAYPPGAAKGARLPLVVALYGREGDYLRPLAVNALALPYYLADGVARGMTPFAIATVESGPTSYWHDRAAGRTQAMVVEEFLPLLAQRGLRTDRLALHGESMGGYGALLLAQTLGKARVAAVAVDGPAIFRRYSETSSVAFDDEADFAAHDVYANPAKLAGIPVRFVCGSLDPFYGAVQDFAAKLHDPPAVTSYATACHHVGYWRSETADQLRFLAGHLSA